MAWLASSSRHN